MSSARFSSSNGVTYPYPASRTWRLGLPVLLLGLALGYKLSSEITGTTSGSLLVGLGLIILIAFYMIWFGGTLIIGAARRSIGMTVTLDGISVATIFGTRWADWSCLGPFVEGSFNAGKQGILPCVTAPVVGPDVSKNLLHKHTFLIANVFGVPNHRLVEDLNTARAGVKLPATYRALSVVGGLRQYLKRLSPTKAILSVIGIALFCSNLYRILTH